MSLCLSLSMPRGALGFFLVGSLLSAQDGLPMPEPKVLLERVLAATKALESAREAYTYSEEITERKLDGRGRPKTVTHKTYEVTKIPGGQVRRLVAEDGQPLSPERAQAQALVVEARLKVLMEPKPVEEAARKPGKGLEVSLSDVLAVLEVSSMERTTLGGRALLVVELRPDRKAKISGLGQRFASKLQGRILVDEASSQVVLAEGRMLESCWVGGGLLGSVAPPSTFKVEQAQVGEGAWMPVSGTFSLHARLVMVPIHMEMSFRCWDFRRFMVEAPAGKPPGESGRILPAAEGAKDAL